jgi:hypothetical protein
MGHSPRYGTKSHVSHISQSYTDVKGEQKYELHDKYVHPVKEPHPNLPYDPRMAYDKESRKRKTDREIREEEEEILRKRDEIQTKKMLAKK